MNKCHKCSLLEKVNELLRLRGKLHRNAADTFLLEVDKLRDELVELGK